MKLVISRTVSSGEGRRYDFLVDFHVAERFASQPNYLVDEVPHL